MIKLKQLINESIRSIVLENTQSDILNFLKAYESLTGDGVINNTSNSLIWSRYSDDLLSWQADYLLGTYRIDRINSKYSRMYGSDSNNAATYHLHNSFDPDGYEEFNSLADAKQFAKKEHLRLLNDIRYIKTTILNKMGIKVINFIDDSTVNATSHEKRFHNVIPKEIINIQRLKCEWYTVEVYNKNFNNLPRILECNLSINMLDKLENFNGFPEEVTGNLYIYGTINIISEDDIRSICKVGGTVSIREW